MNRPALITDHLDIWTAARTSGSGNGRGSGANAQVLYGLKRLRELILDLAVRGKLVPQDPGDEPASMLLKKIAREKARLTREGKIKKAKPLPEIGEDEKPFEAPEGWEWVRLGIISADIHYGYTASANHQIKNVRLLRITDIQNDSVNWDSVPGCEIDKGKVADFKLDNGDILIARTGGTIGKSYLVRDIDLCSVFASYLIRIKQPIIIYSEFIKTYLGSQLYWNQLYNNSMGTGQPNVNGNALKRLVFPLPPLAEQHRIVAKVDELMTLCDRLQQQQTESITTHQTLVETLLSTLTNAADATEFAHAWERIHDNFEILFTTEYSIEQLKQTILQLAIMGKLAPQDPNDEPASVLLGKIAKEKQRLIWEGKIKKAKPPPEIGEDEKPFELPKGWEWVRLGSAGIGSTGKTPSTNNLEYYNGYMPFIGPGHITSYSEITDYEKSLTEEGIKHSTVAEQNDILMVCIGGSVGKSAITKRQIAFNQQINSIHPIFVDSSYLHFAMRAPNFQASILNATAGSATPIINRSKWEELLISLPPLLEQHRIVAIVDELMMLCDTFKAQISEVQTTQVQLADSIVERAVG